MTNTKPKIRIRKRRGDLVHGYPEHWMAEEARQGITLVTYFSTHAEPASDQNKPHGRTKTSHSKENTQ